MVISTLFLCKVAATTPCQQTLGSPVGGMVAHISFAAFWRRGRVLHSGSHKALSTRYPVSFLLRLSGKWIYGNIAAVSTDLIWITNSYKNCFCAIWTLELMIQPNFCVKVWQSCQKSHPSHHCSVKPELGLEKANALLWNRGVDRSTVGKLFALKILV